MNILVVGIGGNGQTFFMNYLDKKLFSVNNIQDSDGLKHISSPIKLIDEYKKCKIIYIYNKTFDAICSHYRRKWPVIQMNKIKNKNTCNINNIDDFFKLTETSLVDHFGCIEHFLQWYNYDFPNGIYFLNLNEINKCELSNFLKCDKSIFDNLIYDIEKRHNYNNLKYEYPLSNIMYKNIDNFINELCIFHNKKLK